MSEETMRQRAINDLFKLILEETAERASFEVHVYPVHDTFDVYVHPKDLDAFTKLYKEIEEETVKSLRSMK